MAFVKKTWKDRLVEFPGRRLLRKISGSDTETVVDIYRNEGDISEGGDAFSSANMNDLEQRIFDEFSEINSNIENLGGFTPVIDSTGKITGYKTEAGADTVFPFSSLIDLPKKIKVASKSITTTTGSGKRTVSVADIIPSNGYIIGFQQVQAISYTLRYSYDAINRTISYDGKVGSVTNFIVWINYIVF